MYLDKVREQEKKEGKNIPGSKHSKRKGPEAERESGPVVRKQGLVGLGKVCKFHSQCDRKLLEEPHDF